ncbi:NAD(P)-dependent oxidoreductase [Oerskovia sp. M15]
MTPTEVMGPEVVNERSRTMRIFLAGATGAVGTRLTPRLVAAGHDVVGTTTSEAKAAVLRAQGAEPVLLDALDAAAVRRAVAAARPDVVVHQLTALSGPSSSRSSTSPSPRRTACAPWGSTTSWRPRWRPGWAASWRRASPGGPTPDGWTGQDRARRTRPAPTRASRKTLEAIRYLEDTTTGTDGIDGIALRFGLLYGPGTGWSASGEQTALVRARRLPVVGGGGGIWSFVHVDDAAEATVAALDRGAPGRTASSTTTPRPSGR